MRVIRNAEPEKGEKSFVFDVEGRPHEVWATSLRGAEAILQRSISPIAEYTVQGA